MNLGFQGRTTLGRRITMDGFERSGHLLAQVGEAIPDLGPSCGLGAGTARRAWLTGPDFAASPRQRAAR